jgi:hypothetical protein
MRLEQIIGDLISRGFQVRFWANDGEDYVEIRTEEYGYRKSINVKSQIAAYRDESRYYMLKKLWLHVVDQENKRDGTSAPGNVARVPVVHDNGYEYENSDLEDQGRTLGFA